MICCLINKKLSRIKRLHAEIKEIRQDVKVLRHQTEVLIEMNFKILELLKPLEAVRVEFYLISDGKEERVDKMIIKATDAAKKIGFRVLDAKGNEALIDGAAKWELTDSALGALVPAEDGKTAMFTPDKLGLGEIKVLVDADLGEGVKEVLGVMPVQVIPGEAVTVELFEVAEEPAPEAPVEEQPQA